MVTRYAHPTEKASVRGNEKDGSRQTRKRGQKTRKKSIVATILAALQNEGSSQNS
jgi:hypothetical protein